MKKIISLAMLVLFFTACQKDDAKIEEVFDTTPKENSLENDIQEISVLIHEGHLHGKNFHYNTPAELLKRHYLAYFKKQENGTWKQILKGEPYEIDFSEKGIPAIGGNRTEDFRKNLGNRYSFEIHYYDKNGKELNSKIAEEEDYYQVFFTTDSYHNLYNKADVHPTQDNGKELINLRYRDTDPIDEMAGKLRDNPIGFKSYMGATKYEVSYNINISLFEWNTPNQKGDGLDFYKLPKSGGRMIAGISIPMDVVYFLPGTDKGIEELNEKFAKYFGVTVEEFKESEDKRAPHDNGGYWM